MNIRDYEYIVEIAAQGSITKAADRLSITAGALSKYLSRMEKELNIQLFKRIGNQLKLTKAGQRYVELGRIIIDVDEQLSRDISGMIENGDAALHLGVPRGVNSFGYGYDCANQLLDEHPELDAIIAAVDVQGLGAIRAVTERGLKIPEQIKTISLTGHHVGRMLETTMTSMEMPAFEMGKTTADLLIGEIEADTGHKPAHRHISFSATLVEREST